MKTKKFSKRLFLGKKTIVNLNDDAMSNLKGGACSARWTGCTTWTCPPPTEVACESIIICETDLCPTAPCG